MLNSMKAGDVFPSGTLTIHKRSATVMDGTSLVFTTAGLPPLPAGRSYELWLMGPRGDRPVGMLPAPRGGMTSPVVATGLATGDYMIICDADLEYSPTQIPDLVRPVQEGEAVVVYGNRTFGSHTSYSFWFVMGNKLVTTFANVLFDCYIGDLETCFKLIPTALYRDLDIRETGFGMEAEVTGKLLRRGIRPYEVPISYKARTRAAGKKLTWRDGVEALWILFRERFTPRRR